MNKFFRNKDLKNTLFIEKRKFSTSIGFIKMNTNVQSNIFKYLEERFGSIFTKPTVNPKPKEDLGTNYDD